MKNSKAARIKMSKVLVTMNKLLYSIFIFDIILCLTFASFNYCWINKHQEQYTYIFNNKKSTFGPVLNFIIYFLTFFVAYSHMIPISLYVALEIVKIIQGFLIHYDNEIFDYLIDKPASCRATDLVEELGQVEFIFSDKTGTLTQNVMVLKKVYLYGKVYGGVQDEAPNTLHTVNGDIHLYAKLTSEETENSHEKSIIEDFFYLLSLCHAVFPEVKENKVIYQGASPDDIALTKGAQQMGFEFTKKVFDDLTIENKIDKTSQTFEQKIEIPFDSDRKRMSVVMRNKETNEYVLYSKGADTMMLPRMNLDETEKEEVNRVIKVLSKEGLRVLVMGKRILDESTYLNWEKRYKEARNNGNEEQLGAYNEEMENSLTFLGCSAIEDKLQEGVSETIYTLLTCNIRIWVLTGDKQDTAEEIAKSCKLINENMFILHLVQDNRDTREKILILKEDFDINIEENGDDKIDLEEVSRKIRKKRGKDMSIIVDGFTLEIILSDNELSTYFFHIAIAAKSVVCCRVTPKQKSKVVSLAKNFGKWVTLSIGDGANDVPMIMEAHIGVGIQGKEGTQAVRSADFSIGQFRFLEKLLLIYGRVGYVKISRFICYYFYKNIILIFTDLLFNFQNGFSGQIYFADYLSTMYNAFFTSWPCLFTFSLERDVDLNIVKRFPILYVAGQKNYFFNLKVFWSYIIYAIFHGFLCYFISNEGLLYSNDTSGITFNHWYKSTTSFSLVIHIVTYKLLLISNFWNGLNLFSTVFSILFYYIVILLLCYDPFSFIFQNEVAGLIYNIVKYPKFWFVMIVGPFLALIPDITIKQIFYSSWPNPTEYIKQHLSDPVFQALIFKEESHSAMFNSAEAKKAEKILKEILKKARDHKMKRRTQIEESNTPLKLRTDYPTNPNFLSLNDNKKKNSQIPTNSYVSQESSSLSQNRNNDANKDLHSNRSDLHSNTEKNKSPEPMKMLAKINTFSKKPKDLSKSESKVSQSFSEKDSHSQSESDRSKENKNELMEFQTELMNVYMKKQDSADNSKNDSSFDSENSKTRKKKKHKTIKMLMNEYQKMKVNNEMEKKAVGNGGTVNQNIIEFNNIDEVNIRSFRDE